MAFNSFRKLLESWDFMILARKLEPALKTYAVQQAAGGLNHFKASWANQGFTDRALEKWKGRKITNLYLKRSVKTKKNKSTFKLSTQARRANNSILIKSGNLRRSWKGEAQGLTLRFYSNLAYAQVHNDGGNAGKGGRSKIPQRKAVGQSEIWEREVEENFYKMMDNLFK